jgi:hypothetical protein
MKEMPKLMPEVGTGKVAGREQRREKTVKTDQDGCHVPLCLAKL